MCNEASATLTRSEVVRDDDDDDCCLMGYGAVYIFIVVQMLTALNM